MSLRKCTDSPEPSLLDDTSNFRPKIGPQNPQVTLVFMRLKEVTFYASAISTKALCAGLFLYF